VIKIEEPTLNINIPTEVEDLDGLGYLEGKDVDFVNTKAFQGVPLLILMVVSLTQL
jgi:glucose-6-phosphate isomerase